MNNTVRNDEHDVIHLEVKTSLDIIEKGFQNGLEFRWTGEPDLSNDLLVHREYILNSLDLWIRSPVEIEAMRYYISTSDISRYSTKSKDCHVSLECIRLYDLAN